MERRINLDKVRETNEFLITENDKLLKELEFLKDANMKLYYEVLELRCVLVKNGLVNEVEQENSFIQKILNK